MRRVVYALMAMVFLAMSSTGLIAVGSKSTTPYDQAQASIQVAMPLSTMGNALDLAATCCGGDVVKKSQHASAHCGADCSGPLPDVTIRYPGRLSDRVSERTDIGNSFEYGSVFRPPIG